MDFKDSMKLLAERVEKLKDNINTEEATKNAFIMPFINSLGYDVFNPLEVVPEMTCDIGIKKGEKIDYAIMKDGEPILLIECKHWQQDLNLHDNQLVRYFHASKVKFGLLTNGIIYRFYTDLIEQNRMDEKPFLEVDITDLKDAQVEELKKFHKSYFDIEKILSSASELKYTSELKSIISKEFSSPSPELVKLFSRQVYEGMITTKILEQFTMLVKKSISSLISDTISDRLKTALKTENNQSDSNSENDQREEVAILNTDGIVTTEEELEGYMIVKAIAREIVDVSRIHHRDALSYFAILFDDNNRKPICRLYFNGNKKYIATFDLDKKEIKNQVESLDDIYMYSDNLKEIIKSYIE